MQANVLDLFHGDDNEEMPNFRALAADGIFAIVHKATQGSHYKDPLFASRIKAADAAGLLVGAYHFGDGSPVETQVQNFIDATQGQPGDFLALDFESNGNQMSFIQAMDFLEELIARGFCPVLYGSNLVKENPWSKLTGVVYLWLAEYGNGEHIPAPWDKNTTLLWQFSERGTYAGLHGHVDLNYFDGTRDELAAKWGKPCQIQTKSRTI